MSSDDAAGEVAPRRRRGRPPRHPLPEPADRAVVILDAALVAFAEHGYVDTGMDEIARRCRMTKPTLYECFASKAELFAALIERERNSMIGTMRETYLRSADMALWDKVRTDTAAFVHWVCDNPEAFALLYLIPSPQTGLTLRAEMQAEIAAALVTSMEKLLVKHGRSGGPSLTVLAYMATSGSLGAVSASRHLLPEHADEVIDLATGFIDAAFRHVPVEAISAFDQLK